MKLNQAKEEFIKAWGKLGKSWGIGRNMAEIHALLLISPYPCSISYIERQLYLSREEAEKGIRDLLEWKVVQEIELDSQDNGHIYYLAEKDIWLLAQLVAKKRREKELLPILTMLDNVQNVENTPFDEHDQEFMTIVHEINSFARKADKFLYRFTNANGNWFFKQILSWVRS